MNKYILIYMSLLKLYIIIHFLSYEVNRMGRKYRIWIVPIILILLLSNYSLLICGDTETSSRTGDNDNQPDIGYWEDSDFVEFMHHDGTHNTSFMMGETIYINITTMVNDNPGELKLRVYDYLGNRFHDIGGFFVKQPGGPPYKYVGTIDATVANGFSNDHFLFEVRLKDNTNIITYDVLEIGGGSDPPKYIKTFNDPDCTIPSHMFTKDQLIWVEVYTGEELPTTANSKIFLYDYRENKHEQTDDIYTLQGNYSRFSYNLSATTINLVEGDWYTVTAFDLRNAGGTHLIENWHAQIQIVPKDIINISASQIMNDTGFPQQIFFSGDKVVVDAQARHNNHASRILGMNMTVSGPGGTLIDDVPLALVATDTTNPPQWKNYTKSFDLAIPPRGDYLVNLTVYGRDGLKNNSELTFKVDNYSPFVEDIAINETMILRNNTAKMFLNGTDIEDIEANLTPIIEYNDSIGTGWSSTYVGAPTFDGTSWLANLSLPIDAPLGRYDLRARFNDTDGDLSDWHYQNDSLLVINSYPYIVELNADPFEVNRTETVTISVTVGDLETQYQDLTVDLQITTSGGSWESYTTTFDTVNGLWSVEITPPVTAILGNYSGRSNVTDDDGNFSLWTEVGNLFIVKNNLPTIADDLDDIEVKTQTTLDLSPYEEDVEDNDEDLIWTLDESSVNTSLLSLEIIDPVNDTLSIIPVVDAKGSDDITLTLSDKDGGNNTRMDITFIVDATVQQNAPRAILLSPAKGGMVNNLRPELRWSIDYFGPDEVYFTIYMDTTPDPRTIVATGLEMTFLSIINPLSEGETYYWTVIPYTDKLIGKCTSGIWSFQIDQNYTITYGVEVTVDTNRIILPQGSSGTVNITVQNLGNTLDVIELAIDRGSFSGTIQPIDMFPVLEPNETRVIRATINVPESALVGDTIIIVKGISQSGGNSVSDTSYFNITIIEKGTVVSHEVELSLKPNIIDIALKKSKVATLTVCNRGEIQEDFILTFTTATFHSGDIQLGVDVISLDPDECKDVTVSITVPEDLEKGKHKITIEARSAYTLDEVDLTVNVKGEDIGQLDQLLSSSWCLPLMILLIMAIIVVIFAITRRKTKEEAMPVPEPEEQEASVTAPIIQESVEDFQLTSIFVIYKGGRLINHTTVKELGTIDKEVMSGMLLAIQSFVKESFQGDTALDSFEFGENKVVLVGGNYTVMAAVIEGKEPPTLREEIRSVIQTIEGMYSGIIEEWNGDLGPFNNIGDYYVPLFKLRSRLRIKEKKKEVKMRSALEFVRGYVRIKVSVVNEYDDNIKEITVTLDHDVNSLKLSHIEPDYPYSGSSIFLTDIYPNEKRTVAVYFDPIICQESHIDGWVTFKDPDGKDHKVNMKRKPVDIVCPIFYTEDTVNVAMLKRLLNELKYKDSRLFPLAKLSSLKIAYEEAKSVVQGYNVKFVREFFEKNPYVAETWYYGEVNKSEEKIVIKVTASEALKYLEIFVATANLASLTGLLAELSHAFKGEVKKKKLLKEVMMSKLDQINLEIKQTRSLLDMQSEGEITDKETEQ